MTSSFLPPLDHIPNTLVSLSDYRERAKQHMPFSIYEYIAGGGADEITLSRNRTKLNDILIKPSVLRSCTHGGTHTQILGKTWRHPMMLAPVAFHQLAHPHGEIATAQAASILETPMCVSTLSSFSMEDIAQHLKSPKWFQLYFQQSREFTKTLVQRAEQAGYTALVVTVDAPLHGIRNRAQRAEFKLPDQIQAINLLDRPELPRASFSPNESIIFQGMMSEAPTWQDIEWLINSTQLPIILKGILNPADARMAKQLGVTGIVVSNHGGRGLDCLPASIESLPAIRDAVGDNYLLLLDSGIERGTDVFKAIALGANAVMIGRPQLYALAVAGPIGVGHMLRILREELEVTMSLAGTPTIEAITAESLFSA
jgi:isopentenyl diphosphate isomerase/L-lactate dehydrogenase-like FMN-dependent dehydrogenase